MSQTSCLYQCRLCLIDSEFCYSIFDEEIADKIELLSSIKIKECDQFPSSCCPKCLEDVYSAIDVRDRIIKSDLILKKKLNDVVDDEGEVGGEGSKDEPIEVTGCDTEFEVLECDLNSNENINDIIYVGNEDDSLTDFKKQLETILSPVKDEDTMTVAINPELIFDLKMKLKEKRLMKNEIDSRGEKIVVSLQSIQGSLQCFDCNKEFINRRVYLHHMKKHQTSTKCGICHVAISYKHYRRHMDLHQSGKQICELCGAMAKNVESLRGHMFYMHKSTADQYKCEECNKFFRFKYKYTLHLRKNHGGAKSHTCEVCGKWFYTFRDVQRHVRSTHLKLRPYICEYCKKGFSSSHAKRTHLRQHTNEKPYKCDVCAEGFKQRVSLKTHLKSKHGMNESSEYQNTMDIKQLLSVSK